MINTSNYKDFINDNWFYSLSQNEQDILLHNVNDNLYSKAELNSFDKYDFIFKITIFRLYSLYEIENIDFLFYLINIEELYLNTNIYSLNIISLSCLRNCKKLKKIYCNNLKLTSLEGLENCINLEYLAINYNRTNLNIDSIKNCINLKYIELNYSKIDNCNSLINLINVFYLSLKGNNIEDISPLRNLKELKFLILDNNKITNFSYLEECNKLEILHIANNNLQSIKNNFNSIKESLIELNISYNNLTNIDHISLFINIEKLICTNNPINDIYELRYLFNLRVVNLMNTNITSIKPLICCYKLEILYFSINISNLKGLNNLLLLDSLRCLQINKYNGYDILFRNLKLVFNNKLKCLATF